VHHGGIGTMSQALAAGVPQLVMPMGHDQPDNARRLKLLGAGDALAPGQFTAERVAERLRLLIGNPRVAAACEKAAGLCQRTNAAGDVLEVLEAAIPGSPD
jgi:UDP:flavonoid glycosyltransferase YjiC (YdhE family)